MVSAVQENLKNKYGVDLKDTYIKNAITIETTTDQLILNIVVQTDDPEISAMIANLVQENADQIYKDVIQYGNVKSVDKAQIPLSASSPNVKVYTGVGLLAGLLIACLIVFITESVDTKIKPKDDLFDEYGIPVFAEIMDFAAADTNTGGYDYEYSTK